MKPRLRLALLAVAASACITTRSAAFYPISWAHQFGTALDDTTWYESGNAIDLDGLGSVYVAGLTNGNLAALNLGVPDTFVRKYDAATGTALWTRQLGTAGGELTHGVAADALGNVFVGGSTYGNLSGPNAGQSDVFIVKYDGGGNLLWTRQVGTSADDQTFSIVEDGLGNAYLTGRTFGSLAGPLVGIANAFLLKYDAAGNQLWARQSTFASFASASAVSVDSAGNAYVTGTAQNDVFLSKYDAAGNFQWNQTLATPFHETGYALDTDSNGNVYVTGLTYGNLGGPNAGPADLFLAKYNPAGALQWVKQLGTPGVDIGLGVAVDSWDNVIISGSTTESLFGANSSPGSQDLILAQFDPNGNLVKSLQLGTTGAETNPSVSLDAVNSIYVAGTTTYQLNDTNGQFPNDIYVIKFVIPEPTSWSLMTMTLVMMCGLPGTRHLDRCRRRPRFNR
jgi:hypothetical protein